MLEYEYLNVVLVLVEPISEITGRVPTERDIEICGRVTILRSSCFSYLVVNKGPHRSGCNCCGIFKYLQSVALEISLQFPRYDADIVVG